MNVLSRLVGMYRRLCTPAGKAEVISFILERRQFVAYRRSMKLCYSSVHALASIVKDNHQIHGS